ncbi:MAG: hypothetical protein AB7E60_00050 [Sphingobium sp.]
MRHDRTLATLTDLLRRIDGLASQRGHLSGPRLNDEVDQIRHIARTANIGGVEGLALTLQSALSLHGQAPVILSYLDRMRDVITSAMPSDDSAPLPFAPLFAISPVPVSAGSPARR